MPQILRSDARDNRDRALDAARDMFAERGIAGVTMRDVARRAEIGPATLYRRFPTKQHLVDAAFADEMGACSDIVRRGAADTDAWRGFCSVMAEICVLNARNQGFTDAFTASAPDDALTAHRSELLALMSGLIRRARSAGRLRADFTVDDFVLILRAGRGLASVPREDRTPAARRFAELAVDGVGAATR